MKNKKVIIAIIGILVFISLLLIIFMTLVIGKKVKFNSIFTKVSTELIVEKNYNINFSNIKVNSKLADIYIKESSDKGVKIKIYGKEEYLILNDSSEELSIKMDAKKCIGFCFNKTKALIEIYLPNDYANNINLENDYGDIFIDNFINSSINSNLKCGNIKIEGAKLLKITNDYGDINVNKVINAEIKESCGDVQINEVSNVKVDNNYGDIKINYVNNYLEIKNDCGDIKIENINLHENSYITNNLGDIKLGKTNEIFIDAKTDLGSVKINNNYNKSDIILKITNDLGDIKIDN